MSNPIDRRRSISKLPPEKRARERESNHVLHKNALPSLNGWSVQVNMNTYTHTYTLYIPKALNHDNVAHKNIQREIFTVELC